MARRRRSVRRPKPRGGEGGGAPPSPEPVNPGLSRTPVAGTTGWGESGNERPPIPMASQTGWDEPTQMARGGAVNPYGEYTSPRSDPVARRKYSAKRVGYANGGGVDDWSQSYDSMDYMPDRMPMQRPRQQHQQDEYNLLERKDPVVSPYFLGGGGEEGYAEGGDVQPRGYAGGGGVIFDSAGRLTTPASAPGRGGWGHLKDWGTHVAEEAAARPQPYHGMADRYSPKGAGFAEGGDVQQPQAGPDIEGYVNGANAMPPDELDAVLLQIAQLDPNQDEDAVNLTAIVQAAQSGDMDRASSILAGFRKRFDSLNAHAQGAIAHGDMATAAQLAGKAHSQIPDGLKIAYTPGQDGSITATITPTGQTFTMSGQQFHDYIVGPATSFDHILENGLEKNLSIASGGQQGGGTTGYAAGADQLAPAEPAGQAPMEPPPEEQPPGMAEGGTVEKERDTGRGHSETDAREASPDDNSWGKLKQPFPRAYSGPPPLTGAMYPSDTKPEEHVFNTRKGYQEGGEVEEQSYGTYMPEDTSRQDEENRRRYREEARQQERQTEDAAKLYPNTVDEPDAKKTVRDVLNHNRSQHGLGDQGGPSMGDISKETADLGLGGDRVAPLTGDETQVAANVSFGRGIGGQGNHAGSYSTHSQLEREGTAGAGYYGTEEPEYPNTGAGVASREGGLGDYDTRRVDVRGKPIGPRVGEAVPAAAAEGERRRTNTSGQDIGGMEGISSGPQEEPMPRPQALTSSQASVARPREPATRDYSTRVDFGQPRAPERPPAQRRGIELPDNTQNPTPGGGYREPPPYQPGTVPDPGWTLPNGAPSPYPNMMGLRGPPNPANKNYEMLPGGAVRVPTGNTVDMRYYHLMPAEDPSHGMIAVPRNAESPAVQTITKYTLDGRALDFNMPSYWDSGKLRYENVYGRQSGRELYDRPPSGMVDERPLEQRRANARTLGMTSNLPATSEGLSANQSEQRAAPLTPRPIAEDDGKGNLINPRTGMVVGPATGEGYRQQQAGGADIQQMQRNAGAYSTRGEQVPYPEGYNPDQFVRDPKTGGWKSADPGGAYKPVRDVAPEAAPTGAVPSANAAPTAGAPLQPRPVAPGATAEARPGGQQVEPAPREQPRPRWNQNSGFPPPDDDNSPAAQAFRMYPRPSDAIGQPGRVVRDAKGHLTRMPPEPSPRQQAQLELEKQAAGVQKTETTAQGRMDVARQRDETKLTIAREQEEGRNARADIRHQDRVDNLKWLQDKSTRELETRLFNEASQQIMTTARRKLETGEPLLTSEKNHYDYLLAEARTRGMPTPRAYDGTMPAASIRTNPAATPNVATPNAATPTSGTTQEYKPVVKDGRPGRAVPNPAKPGTFYFLPD